MTPAKFFDMSDTPKPPENIVLTGFMGSGKSSVGRLLAKRLRFHFVDMDALIERAEHLCAGYELAQMEIMATVARAKGALRQLIAKKAELQRSLGERGDL